MTVNILGTEYEIVIKKYDEDEHFDRYSIDGYCDWEAKQIVVCDMTTYKGWGLKSPKLAIIAQKQIVRHEIVHAFFNESGLMESANCFDGAWAKNEEMIGWISLQGEKIYKAWQEADAL